MSAWLQASYPYIRRKKQIADNPGEKHKNNEITKFKRSAKESKPQCPYVLAVHAVLLA